MAIGIHLQLFNGSTPQANLSDIQALWWDITEPKDAQRPIGKTSVATTDSNGYLDLDLSNVTGLSVGGFGFLTLYKKDATDHQDSLVFSGKVAVETITSGVDMYYYDSGWTRPSDWLTLPTVTSSDRKFVGLFGVFDHESNFVALTAAGNFTVDWGDGSATENIASGVTAQHVYTYSSISNDTLCSRGYKQVIVTVTPQSGQSLTQVNLQKRHSSASAQVQRIPWLDIACSVTASTSNPLICGQGTNVVALAFLEQVVVHNTQLCTGFSSMFNFCYSLQSIPLLNTAAGTTFANMFGGCYNLLSIPLLNTAAGTNFSSMFQGCYSLQSIPLLNTALGTRFDLMFGSCLSLLSIPLLNTALGTNFSGMFQYCHKLQSIPLLNTALGTNFSSMFNFCYNLQSIPLLNTASGTNFSYMFNNCYGLQSVPLLNTALGTNFSYMFNSCYNLQSIPLLNTAAGTDFSNMFNNCYGLQAIPALSLISNTATALTNLVTNCYSLARSKVTNVKLTHSYANCNLSATALNEIYTNLPTVTGQTITVTGNYGVASDNPTIATAKGWTVTG